MHSGKFNDIQNGFTLIELLVVLLILSVLAFFAYPSYHALMQRVESHSVRRHIHEAIRLAKIESRTRAKDVLICTMVDGACSRSAQSDLVVFVDTNRNNRFDAKDVIISKEQLALKYGIISMNVSAGRDYAKFMGDTGKPRGNFGNIKYCNILNQKQHSFQVIINMHGLVLERRADRLDIGC